MSKSNPPAFPRPQFNTQGVGYEDAGIGNEAQDCMTLRDYFAAKAMAVLLHEAMKDSVSQDLTVTSAYAIADAMLKAREQ